MFPLPKILTAIVVPTGGWDLDFKVSNAASLDTSYTATVPAGTYFLSWDCQADDLLYQLSKLMTDAIAAGIGGARYVYARINTDKKVEFVFYGSAFVDSAGHENDVELTWDASSADLAAALGFSAAAADASTGTDNPVFTADWQHGFGWYADHAGQLKSLRAEDSVVTQTAQAVGYGGHIATQQLGTRYENELALDHLPRALTFSRGVAYGAVSVYPYERNTPLESWWHAAATGTRFRVYREGRVDAVAPIDRGVNDTANAGYVEATGKNWATSPQVHKGLLCHIVNRTATDDAGRFYISSNTATTLVSPANAPDGQSWQQASASAVFYVLEQRYETYVVDIVGMTKFEPTELKFVDRYSISIPLLRYEA